MLTPLYLIVGLTVATCVIAYWSDNLGKKLGKKRISLFGLRPRQTATLISMASSVGIMILTLVVLLAFNSSLRRALFRFDAINAQNKELSREAKQLQADVTKLTTQAQTLQQQNAQSRHLTASAKKQLNAVKVQLASIKHNLDTARTDLTAARQGETAAKRGEQQAYRETKQAQARVVRARGLVYKAQSQLTDVNAQLRQSKANLNAVRANLATTRTLLATTKSQLRTAQRATATMQRATASTMQSIRQFTEKSESLQAQVKEQEALVTNLENQRKELDTQIQGLQKIAAAADQMALMADRIAVGNVLVPVNQMLAARLVPARSGFTQVKSILRGILADATEVVRMPPVKAQEVHLYPIRLEREDRRIELDEDEILNSLADYLSDFNAPVSVRLVAAYNHIEGATEIMGRMQVVPVQSAVLKSGQVLKEAVIDGTQNDARIFNQLLALVNEGEKEARNRGVIPALTLQSPNFYAAGTNERIFEALRRIQKVRGPAKVELVVAENLSTVDPVQVRFEISRA